MRWTKDVGDGVGRIEERTTSDEAEEEEENLIICEWLSETL